LILLGERLNLGTCEVVRLKAENRTRHLEIDDSLLDIGHSFLLNIQCPIIQCSNAVIQLAT
jgi:hypothetical protein